MIFHCLIPSSFFPLEGKTENNTDKNTMTHRKGGDRDLVSAVVV